MLQTDLPSSRAGQSAFAHEYLASWERIQRDTRLSAADLCSDAERAIVEQMGTSTEKTFCGFAPAAIGMLTDHCDLIPGFGLLMPLPIGVAVAVRKAGDHIPENWTAEGSVFRLDIARGCTPRQPWCTVLSGVLSELFPASPPTLDVAVRCSHDEPMSVSGIASTLVAFTRALIQGGMLDRITSDVLRKCHTSLVTNLGIPLNVTSILGAHAVELEKLALVDAKTFEGTTIDLPDRKRIGWGLVQMGRVNAVTTELISSRRAEVEQAIAHLQRTNRFNLESLRDLDHRDLKAALDLLPSGPGRIVRYAVTENSRVQKMVVAIRKNDWQFAGALMLMSHAALRDEMGLSSTETDFVVAEANNVEGVFGARRVGRSFFGNVLCMGQPFSVVKYLDHIDPAYKQRFGTEAHTVLL